MSIRPYVTVDRGAEAETAVCHLTALGHRRIALPLQLVVRGSCRARHHPSPEDRHT